MARIVVERIDGDTYEVMVDDGGSTSSHTVIAGAGLIEELGGGAGGEAVIEASFRFLLDRESKESILRRFDLTVIGGYFPEYRDMVGEYLVHD
jgi:hypothetical protein